MKKSVGYKNAYLGQNQMARLKPSTSLYVNNSTKTTKQAGEIEQK